jgi:mono/diheme cytochrome c family protein
MGSRILPLMLWAVVMGMPVAARAQDDRSAQIEQGRQVVAQACATCHTTIVRMIQVHKLTAEQWKDTVHFMISRGAQIMPGEIDAVTAFLAESSARASPGGRGGRQQAAAGDAPGILQRNCQQCHELATATNKPASEAWSAVVTRMMAYGAKLSVADQETLVAYLDGLKK